MPRFTITVMSPSTAPTPPPSVGACSTPIQGTRTFDVGPGKTHTELTSVPWLSLQAGDVVNIFYRPQPYRTKIGIRAQGTASAPVIINGVTDAGCNRPTLSGDGAEPTADAIRESYWNEHSEGLGAIVLFKGPRDPWGHKAKFVQIRNLRITGAKATNSYVSQEGVSERYSRGAAGIYGVTVEDLLVENCEITGNDNGLFVNTKNDNAEEASHRVTVRRNSIHLNGVPNSYLEHNLYVQAVRPVYEGNYIGQLVPGAEGSSLKDRSSGTIIRYNHIVAAARALDLVETEGGSTTVYVDPQYHDAWVYGNVIVSDHSLPGESSNSLIHWGGDNSPQYFRSGTLYFYHNTVVTRANSSDVDEMHLFDLPSDTQKVELRSNVLAHFGSSRFVLAEVEGTIRFLGTNWITSGWMAGNFWSGNSVVVEVEGRLIEGSDPALQPDYTLASGSGAIDQGAAAPAHLASRWIDYQYAPTGSYVTRSTVGGGNDLGAFEHR
jgi:hypothetical protein